MIDSSIVRNIETAQRLLTEALGALEAHASSLPSPGWADPSMSEAVRYRITAEWAIGSVRAALDALPGAAERARGIWEACGSPEAPCKPLITWKDGRYADKRGTAGGIEVFSISWHTRQEDPNYIMRGELPGLGFYEEKHDDAGVLKASAEKHFAAWLARVSGGAS